MVVRVRQEGVMMVKVRGGSHGSYGEVGGSHRG